MKMMALLAAAFLVGAAASAPAQVFGFGFGRGGYRHRSYSSFGLGFGGYGYARPRVVYQNAFTGDVGYAERATNGFRREYERRKGDPLGIKADVQLLDRTLEALRKEAERYGAPTDRGADLARQAQDAEDRIDRRFRDSRDSMDRQWREVARVVDRLTGAFRPN